MARKKKTEEKLVIDMPGTLGAAKVVFPQVTKGSHLTVTKYEDGRTKLEWDDAALLRDVTEAIAAYESQPAAGKIARKTKVTHKVKSF